MLALETKACVACTERGAKAQETLRNQAQGRPKEKVAQTTLTATATLSELTPC